MEPDTRNSLMPPREKRGRQTRFLLWIGFGGLLMLMAVLGVSAVSLLYQIELRQQRIRTDYVERDRAIEKLRSSIYLSGTYARDFLLDSNDHSAIHHRDQFLQERSRVTSLLSEYEHVARPAERGVLAQLSKEIDNWFNGIEPTLSWTADQRRNRGYAFVETEILPRRMLAVGLADRVHELSEKQFEASSEQVGELFAAFRARLIAMLIFTILAGSALAG